MQAEIENVQAELIKRLNYFDNWKDKYKYLIDMGKQLPPFDDALKTETNLIHGCQSQVWIDIDYRDGRLFLKATIDAAIVAGLIALLLKVYSGRTPQEIINMPMDFLSQTGLLQHLSPNRSTGLYHMIKRIQAEAQTRLPS